MAQQTSVEWLESKFQKFLLYYEGNHKAEPYTIQELSNDFEEAKHMERQQIEDAYEKGQDDKSNVYFGNEYYNEKYKSTIRIIKIR